MIKDNDLYCFCDLPKLPQEIIDEIYTSVNEGYATGKNLQFLTRSSVTPEEREKLITKHKFAMNGKQYKRAIYRRYDISEKAIEWVKKNITPNFGQVGSQLVCDGEVFTPHTDGGPREYILNYLIEAGGPAVETQWYQERGFPLHRLGRALQYPEAENLDLVKSIIIPEGTWTMLYGKVIHSVAEVTGKRVQISIALSKEEFVRLKATHGFELTYHG